MFTEIYVQSFKSILQFAMHWLHENANVENFDVFKSTLKIAPMKKKIYRSLILSDESRPELHSPREIKERV